MRRKPSPVVSGAFGRLFENATARTLDVLILHRGNDLSHKDLAEYAGISTRALSKTVLPKLFKLGLVTHTRDIGHAKMITLNTEGNSAAEHLVACEIGLSLREAYR